MAELASENECDTKKCRQWECQVFRKGTEGTIIIKFLFSIFCPYFFNKTYKIKLSSKQYDEIPLYEAMEHIFL